MEQCALENGQISYHQIISILDDFRNGIRDDVRQQLETMRAQQGLLNQQNGGTEQISIAGDLNTAGRFWDVP
jgi:hypothetical protein